MRKRTGYSAVLAMGIALALGFGGAARAEEGGAPTRPDLDARGDRIEQRLDRKGDRIDQHLDRRGERVNARLDRKGDRIDQRLDRRADHRAR
jgi:hypothetical protein